MRPPVPSKTGYLQFLHPLFIYRLNDDNLRSESARLSAK